MKKLIIILVPVVAVVAVALLAVIFTLSPGKGGADTSIQAYVSLNISQLSPVKATLGGQFHTTSIEAKDGTGVVHYEDGHNAYVADFTYADEGKPSVHVTSFTVRQ